MHTKITVFKYNFPHNLSTNSVQILCKIAQLPFKHVYHQSYFTLNQVKFTILTSTI